MVARHPQAHVDVGIVGGSGFYEFLTDTTQVEIDTPYGPPSAPVFVGKIDGRDVGFLPRHGTDHSLPPHRVNYRANIWAMKHLGASDMILTCAAGSLARSIAPGSFVIADQVVDRTQGRPDTFYDGPQTVHISFADPYDEEMRQVGINQAQRMGLTVHEHGTIVVVNGPRFSTRAESQYFSRQGWDVINMTQYPEVILCRELEMAALNITLITDYDVGLTKDPDIGEVTHAEVLTVMAENTHKLRDLLLAVVPALPLSPGRPALQALSQTQG
ncbi:MAG: S-methyl-5'-thioadenosine phosphorylase [Euzebya sp.]